MVMSSTKPIMLIASVLTMSLTLTACSHHEGETKSTEEVAAELSEIAREKNPAPVASQPATPVSALAAAPAASAPTTAAAGGAGAGEALYNSVCQTCHSAGLLGAPKSGDKAAWAPRIAQGKEVLYNHAINGFQGKSGAMPPKGGSNASDEEVKAAVDYMVDLNS